MPRVEFFLKKIDLINEWAGKIFALAFVPLVFIASYEVVMRYIFNRPTIWAWDVNVQLGALLIIMGAGYTLLYDGHVRVDVIYNFFSLRHRTFLDLVTSPLFFLTCVIVIWKGGGEAWNSLKIKEAYTSIWSPPIYPLKLIVPVGVFLLMLQGLAKFIRNLILFTTHKKSNGGNKRVT
jgi:TRAP-type mannitol/chloroaromatic compound transport system permease small subunit